MHLIYNTSTPFYDFVYTTFSEPWNLSFTYIKTTVYENKIIIISQFS